MSKRSREEDTEERYPEKWATQVVISDMMCEFLEIPRYYECSLGHARNLAMHKLVRYFKDNNLQRLEDRKASKPFHALLYTYPFYIVMVSSF
jgi:hypothetical protein